MKWRPDPLTVRSLLIVAVFPLCGYGARAVYGDAGVNLALLAALSAVVVVFHTELRPERGGEATAEKARTSGLRDQNQRGSEWRSERWIRDQASTGLRALDDWRRTQPRGGR